MAIAVNLSGCLITQPVHYDEPPNSPPAIYDTSPSTHPRSRIIELPEATTGADAGMANQLDLEVTVFDADVDQDLAWIAYVDDDRAPCDMCSGFIPHSTLSTDRQRRLLTVSVPLTQLMTTDASCHRIDLYVSSAFNPGGHVPRLANDLATATWWVSWQPTGVGAPLSMCPQ